jgi:hypothetical protein
VESIQTSMENLRKVFSRIRRIRGKYSSAHEEYDEVRIVYGTQNRLPIRGKYFNLLEEYEESI